MGQDDATAVTAKHGWTAITDAFAVHAQRTPDALAIEANGQRLTYREMADRIELFATRLIDALPVGADDTDLLIGVCLNRDIDLPAWLFAIMRIGGAYLPIDPTTPAVRLVQVLEDARPALIVASRGLIGVVAAGGVPVMIAEDTPADPLPLAPTVAIDPDSLAYVIFTSGSTGRPKGVEIEHRSLAALMRTMADSPGLAAGERMLGLTRISFDLSVPDLFLPFWVGASLALVEIDVAADPHRLAAAFDDYRPDLAQATPSTWRGLIEGGWEGLPGLRILAGGEALTRALANLLLTRCDVLWNIYGPTETTVWSTAARVEPGEGAIPIGWPMTGYRVHVVGADGARLPPGATGEIVIGGTGVARGYRNRPELTADRFVTGPDGARTYRTGDLGRFDESGALFCLGRLDDQVKLRGFRIELGDVEAALALHPGVAWAAARLWTDPTGEPTLVAYQVPRQGQPASVRGVRAFLATQIAPYMMPDRIVTLPLMPLTANGKVDRAALPTPFDAAKSSNDGATSTPDRLSAIWAELLGIATISADDDFFDLGGYSLMTVRLARQIEAAFGVKLALIDLLRHSTLRAMAARIDRGDGASDAQAMLLNAGGQRPPLHWLDAGPLMRTMARGLAPDQPAYALNLDPEDEDALGTGDLAIDAVAERLKAKLYVQQPRGPYFLGGWCRWGIVAFELAQQILADGSEVGLLILIDADRPGLPQRPLPLRRRLARWLRTPPGDHPPERPSFSQRVEMSSRRYRAARYGGAMLLLRPATARGDGGWGTLVGGALALETVPGDHETMVRSPAVQVLAAAIDRHLADAQQQSAGIDRSLRGSHSG